MPEPSGPPGSGGLPVSVVTQRRVDDVEVTRTRVRGTAADTPDGEEIDAVATQMRAIVNEAEEASVHLAADHPAQDLDGLIEAVADAVGFSQRRDLFQLRRTLPVESDHPRRSGPAVTTRAFRPGTDDEAAWIRVNNRAFADHPDQGHENPDTLAARMAEPWFDPAGFLVADDPERPGEFSGFCWTKVHPATDTDPTLGEIYVIGVDPAHQGQRLGPVFVLAGLDHLAATGVDHASLYVDESNEGARRLYDALGFHVHERRRVYTP